MITINLLPEEMRKVEHTPLARFLTIIGGTVLVAILGILWFQTFLAIRTEKQNIRDLDKQILSLQSKANEFTDLTGELGKMEKRRKVINELESLSRVKWARKLDELSDAMQAAPFAWLQQFNVQPMVDDTNREVLQVQMECYTSYKDVDPRADGHDFNGFHDFKKLLNRQEPFKRMFDQREDESKNWELVNYLEESGPYDLSPVTTGFTPDGKALRFMMELRLDPNWTEEGQKGTGS